MLDKYYKYKFDYKEYIILIKSGIFYECIGKDALIINKIFNYKIKKINNTFKCGFPINNIKYVISILKQNNINYIIFLIKVSTAPLIYNYILYHLQTENQIFFLASY